jgi:hypothetical protein
MKPFKIEKIEVQAKSRALKATWTVEAAQDLKSTHNVDIEAEIARAIQEEIDREIMVNILMSQGWTEVVIGRQTVVDTNWCKNYIKKPFKQYDHCWYFEDERDANFFTLKWRAQTNDQ